MDMTEQLNWTKLNSSDIRFAAWCIWSRTKCVLHCFSHVKLFATPWTVARQAPLSMGFSRQEYWRRLPCSPPGNLPYWGIKTVSLISPGLAGRYETLWFTSHVNTLFQRNYKFYQWFCFCFLFPTKKNVLKRCPCFCLDSRLRKREQIDSKQLAQTWFVMCCDVEIFTLAKLTTNGNCYKKSHVHL